VQRYGFCAYPTSFSGSSFSLMVVSMTKINLLGRLDGWSFGRLVVWVVWSFGGLGGWWFGRLGMLPPPFVTFLND
jgi:hypothetical protein